MSQGPAINAPDIVDRAGRALGIVASVTNLAQLGGAAVSMNTGVRDAGTQRVTVATNDSVPVTDAGGSFTVDAPVATPVFVRLSDGAAAQIGQKAMAASLPVTVASDQSAIKTIGDPKVTYHAIYRLAARPYALSAAAIAANTRKQYATLHHLVGATKKLKLRRVLIAFESETVAGMITFDLMRISAAPATGNPAITPAPSKQGAAAAEAVALALPTTAGTEGAVLATLEFNVGITGAVGVTNPPQPVPWYELYSEDEQNPMGEQEAFEVAAATLGGWAVTVDNVGATNTVKALVKIVFTEE